MALMVQDRSLLLELQEALKILRAGTPAVAVAAYQKIVREHPTLPQAWHFLGVGHLQMGQTGDGIDAIRRALALDGSKSTYHNNLGVALLSQGLLEEAKKAFERAVTLNPCYADAISNLGQVLGKLGFADEAVRLLRDALRIEPRHPDALFNLANSVCEQGHSEEAIGLYRQAAAIQPTRGDILNNLGIALLNRARQSEALESLEQALAVDPRCAEAAYNAAKIYADEEKFLEAEVAFGKAARLRPDKPLWGLQPLGHCPTVFGSEEEIDHYRENLEQRLDQALQTPMRLEANDLAREAFVPPFNLSHQGRSDRRILEKFAAFYAPHIGKRNPRVTPGKPRIGFVVTAPHVGSFLRTQGGKIENLDARRFAVAVLCSEKVIGHVRQRIHRAISNGFLFRIASATRFGRLRPHRAMCSFFTRSARTRWLTCFPLPAWPPCNARAGPHMAPADFRTWISTSPALSWRPATPTSTTPKSWFA